MGTPSYPNTHLSIILALCVHSVAEICTLLNVKFKQVFLFLVHGAVLYNLIHYILQSRQINVIWNTASDNIHQQNLMIYITPFTILLVSNEWLQTKYKGKMMIQFQGKMLFFIVRQIN